MSVEVSVVTNSTSLVFNLYLWYFSVYTPHSFFKFNGYFVIIIIGTYLYLLVYHSHLPRPSAFLSLLAVDQSGFGTSTAWPGLSVTDGTVIQTALLKRSKQKQINEWIIIKCTKGPSCRYIGTTF